MHAWILLLAGLFISSAFVASFAPDLAHTSVHFGASYLDRSMMRGRLDKTGGAINFDEATHQSGFDFTIDADPISTCLHVLDDVPKSEQFLDAVKFPVIRLRNDRFVVEGGKLIAIKASLTLHGVTQPVWLEVRCFSCGDEEMPGSTHYACGGDLHLATTRSAFGMTRFLPDVGDRIDLDISVEATPQ